MTLMMSPIAGWEVPADDSQAMELVRLAALWSSRQEALDVFQTLQKAGFDEITAAVLTLAKRMFPQLNLVRFKKVLERFDLQPGSELRVTGLQPRQRK